MKYLMAAKTILCLSLFVARRNCSDPFGFAMNNLIFRNTSTFPKVWHLQVRNFLFLRLPRQVTLTKSLQKLFGKLMYISNLFVLFGRIAPEGVPAETIVKVECGAKKVKSERLTKGALIMTSASGKIVDRKREIKEWKDRQRRCRNRFWAVCFFAWTFSLHPEVRLNLTFDTIDFINGMQDCCLGKLTVTSGLSVQTLGNVSKPDFVFCGPHSKFHIFPVFSQISLSRQTYITSEYNILLFFSILDTGTVYSIQPNKSKYHLPQLTSKSKLYDLPSRNKQLHLYHLHTQAMQRIVLHLERIRKLDVVVHNGPGEQSEILTPSNDKILTSSFVCFLKIVFPGSSNQTGFFLDYVAHNQESTLNVSLTKPVAHKVLSIPHFDCINAPCVVQVHAIANFKVNVSVTHFQYDGVGNSGCLYGGLVGAERKTDQWVMLGSHCQTHHNPIQNIYSTTCSLTLIVYWFKHYSNVNVVLNTTLTKCKPVFINVCLYDYLCSCSKADVDYLRACQRKVKRKWPRCAKYVNSISVRLNQSFQYEHSESKSGFIIHGAMTLSLKQNECVVIRLSQTDKMFQEYMKILLPHHLDLIQKCQLQLRPRLGTQLGHVFIFDIFAHLATPKINIVHDFLKFYGFPDYFFDSEKGKRESFRKAYHKGTWEEYPFFCRTKSPTSWCAKQQSRIYIRAKAKSPEHNSVLTILNEVQAQSIGTWIDIVVWKELTAPEKEYQWQMQTFFLKRRKCFRHYRHFPSSLVADQVMTLTLDIPKKVRSFVPTRKFYLKVRSHNAFDRGFAKSYFIFYRLQFQIQKVLSKYQNKFEISSPGFSDMLSFWMHYKKRTGSKFKMTAIWTWGYHKKYHPFMGKGEECHSNATSLFVNLDLCFNFSKNSVSYTKYYVLFSAEYNLYKLSLNNASETLETGHRDKLRSWEDASQLCKSAGVLLPYFNSQPDEQEFLAWIKISPSVPPLEGVYIGLHFKHFRNVRFFYGLKPEGQSATAHFLSNKSRIIFLLAECFQMGKLRSSNISFLFE